MVSPCDVCPSVRPWTPPPQHESFHFHSIKNAECDDVGAALWSHVCIVVEDPPHWLPPSPHCLTPPPPPPAWHDSMMDGRGARPLL